VGEVPGVVLEDMDMQVRVLVFDETFVVDQQQLALHSYQRRLLAASSAACYPEPKIATKLRYFVVAVVPLVLELPGQVCLR
jgi:hypothetical protein